MTGNFRKTLIDHARSIAGVGFLNPLANAIFTFMAGYMLLAAGRIMEQHEMVVIGGIWMAISAIALIIWMFRPLNPVGTLVTFLAFVSVSSVGAVSLVWIAPGTGVSPAMFAGAVLLSWQVAQTVCTLGLLSSKF